MKIYNDIQSPYLDFARLRDSQKPEASTESPRNSFAESEGDTVTISPEAIAAAEAEQQSGGTLPIPPVPPTDEGGA